MERSPSLLLATLLFSLLLTPQVSQAYWKHVNGTDDVKEWVEDAKEPQQLNDGNYAEVQDSSDMWFFYLITKSVSSAAPGTYQCVAGENYLLMSDNYPSAYPAGSKKRWIFKTDSETLIKIHCPIIRIPPSKRCKRDKLVIFMGKKFRRGVRRCGRINNYRWMTYENMKITFKSNSDSKTSKGFMCYVSCEGLPTTSTTTTTTTYSPLCPDPAFPPPVPTPVSTCADIPSEFSDVCSCNDCSGKISLTCNFCTRCDFDMFALLDFSVDVALEPHFNCSMPMDISGWFWQNADNIVALRLCINEDMSHITFPFTELTSLNTLAYQNCNNTLIDICTNSRRKRLNDLQMESKAMVPSPRASFPATLPDAADIPAVVNLYLHDVDMTIDDTTLSCPNLQEISISSDDVEILGNAFSNQVALEMLYVKMCKTELVSDAFRLTATFLESLTIDDTCVHTIASDSIVLEGLGSGRNSPVLRDAGNIITVSVTASATLYRYIPQCPFRDLLELDCVELVWNTEVHCRNCGGVWYWDLTTDEIANITASCLDVLTGNSNSLATYIANNPNPCGFSFPYTGCS